jgi:membrane protein required for beta-lactamase induction
VGRGSLQPSIAAAAPEHVDVATARGAWRIVRRALYIWVVAIAVMVITGTAV